MADWARKVLKFDEEDVAILRKQRINGRRLLRVPTLRELKSYGLSEGSARTLWAEIEKMKKAQADSGVRLILIFFFNVRKHLMIYCQSNWRKMKNHKAYHLV